MNKNLEVIQKVSQVARIVCRVLFVCSVVGAALTLVAAIMVACGAAGELFKVGNITFYGIIADDSMPASQTVLLLIAVLIALIPSAILMKFAEGYFALELKQGTPFTLEGAERIKKLGIMTIVMPLAAEIIVQTMAMIASGNKTVEVSSGGSIITGLLLIFLHFVFKYGAELSASGSVPAAPAVTENKEG